MKRFAVATAAVAMASAAAWADKPRPAHPYFLWTKKDVAEIRQRIETQPWAKKAYDEMLTTQDKQGDEIRNLFRYAVMGDKAAGDIERKNLAKWVKAPDPLGASIEWRILAYDVLYNDLTAEERTAIEERLKRYITYANEPGMAYNAKLFNNAVNYARYDGENGRYTRTNWLPNIIWPWKTSSNLAALALGDEGLIRETWSTPASMKWYFDEYLADHGFYMEEFGKMVATPGAMLMYAMGARNIGLDDLGFGYTGKGGATMRGHIASVIDITYPQIDLGSSRPMFPQVTIGDLRPYPPFQYTTVRGYYADGKGGDALWVQAGAWGGTTRGNSQQWDGDKTEKLSTRQWFEIGHRFWPDAGFDYFLAQMRGPNDDRYYPQLYWNIDPIDPAKVKPPVRKSAVWQGRGMAVLRHDETASAWTSPAPMAALRFTNEYAHHVNDQLALAGYMAFNRMILVNPKVDPSYAFGFSRSVRSHCSVMVDGHIKVDDWGKTGSIEPKFTDDCKTRELFTPEVKFVAARTTQRYPGVDETRALFLTGEYMLDIFNCTSDKPRAYTWLTHTYGVATPDDGVWRESKELADLIPQLTDERSLATDGKPWSIIARQVKRADEIADHPLPDAWFDRKVGVQIRMLGEPGTTAFLTRTPHPRSGQADKPAARPIVDGITVVATRQANATTFAALYEPFENDTRRIESFERVAQSSDAIAVSVRGKGFSDRLLVRYGEKAADPITLEGNGERFVFVGQAYLRVSNDTVTVRGDVREMTLRIGDAKPKLLLNGKTAKATISDGVLRYAP